MGWETKRANDYAESQKALALRLGISRARVGQIEHEAMVKIRALIFGTDDYPLLREVFGRHARSAIERDLLEAERGVLKMRAGNLVAKLKRRKPSTHGRASV